ncbi:35900_t:CDS:2 [Gigaspora margarita]|uniref:35900_t:CDS:1 n=1 Tax=Gigaspora margarita TaxID=4874 RepID=A0ABM8W7D8_GIGMA|nr:35900_t:CDS:2 [Gigaspora margarita]
MAEKSGIRNSLLIFEKEPDKDGHNYNLGWLQQSCVRATRALSTQKVGAKQDFHI